MQAHLGRRPVKLLIFLSPQAFVWLNRSSMNQSPFRGFETWIKRMSAVEQISSSKWTKNKENTEIQKWEGETKQKAGCLVRKMTKSQYHNIKTKQEQQKEHQTTLKPRTSNWKLKTSEKRAEKRSETRAYVRRLRHNAKNRRRIRARRKREN